ncbi:MAG TPA: hypothetical protein VEY70_25555 [Metabacillus sp.]|nr:hypothetical protein [Metabacillus sp.]
MESKWPSLSHVGGGFSQIFRKDFFLAEFPTEDRFENQQDKSNGKA